MRIDMAEDGPGMQRYMRSKVGEKCFKYQGKIPKCEFSATYQGILVMEEIRCQAPYTESDKLLLSRSATFSLVQKNYFTILMYPINRNR